jgi:hypothetical protein
MADSGRVVVGCSRGEESPDSVAVSYLTAARRSTRAEKWCSG